MTPTPHHRLWPDPRDRRIWRVRITEPERFAGRIGPAVGRMIPEVMPEIVFRSGADILSMPFDGASSVDELDDEQLGWLLDMAKARHRGPS